MTAFTSGRSGVNWGIYKNIIRRFKKNNNGFAAVEFALVIIPFVLLVLFTMECARMIYLHATIDLSLSEASQLTSNAARSNDPANAFDYENAFRQAFRDNLKNMPLAAVDNDDQITVSVKYCQNVTQVINNSDPTPGKSCDSKQGTNNPLAIYNVTYEYKPLFFLFADRVLDLTLSRSIVHVQEYERFSL